MLGVATLRRFVRTCVCHPLAWASKHLAQATPVPTTTHNQGRASPPLHSSPPPVLGAARLRRPRPAPRAGGAPKRRPPQRSTSAGRSRGASRHPPARAGGSPGAGPLPEGGPCLRGLWRSTSAHAGLGGCPPSLQQAQTDPNPGPVRAPHCAVKGPLSCPSGLLSPAALSTWWPFLMKLMLCQIRGMTLMISRVVRWPMQASMIW